MSRRLTQAFKWDQGVNDDDNDRANVDAFTCLLPFLSAKRDSINPLGATELWLSNKQNTSVLRTM